MTSPLHPLHLLIPKAARKSAPKETVSQENEMAIFETSVGAMMMWAIAGAASLLIAAVPNVTNGLPEDQRLICICIAGGIGGGILSVLLFPKTTLRSTAAKWFVSPVTAGIFGPALCQYYGFQNEVWYALAANGAIGLFAWSALFVVLPLAPDVARYFAKKWFPRALQLEEDEDAEKNGDQSTDQTSDFHGSSTMQDRSPRRKRMP